MNNINLKRMKLISYIWGFILVLIVVALTVFGFAYKNKTSIYKEYENTLNEKAKEYIDNLGIYIEDSIKVTGEELVENNYLETIMVNESNCNAYTIVKNEKNNYTYKSYLKCNNYKTKDYEKFS